MWNGSDILFSVFCHMFLFLLLIYDWTTIFLRHNLRCYNQIKREMWIVHRFMFSNFDYQSFRCRCLGYTHVKHIIKYMMVICIVMCNTWNVNCKTHVWFHILAKCPILYYNLVVKYDLVLLLQHNDYDIICT